jgi:1-acyl-sn-glycerol-3-phosphate acyltransferase
MIEPEREDAPIAKSKKARRGHHVATLPGSGRSAADNAGAVPPVRRARTGATLSDRSNAATYWYHLVRFVCAILATVLLRWRATGQSNVPATGGALLVSNHVSYFDVVLLGIPVQRPLNYMARSTLFLPLLGWFIRSVGAFPIQRDGMGASGMKETLRRLREGGIVTLFPEGTRSPDGKLGPLKPGIAVLVERVGVPVVPAGVAGMFEIWPKSRPFPVPNPIRVHYGRPIFPAELAGLDAEAITALIRARMDESYQIAHSALQSDMTY